MIARGHDLPVARQAQLLNISRGGVYYVPRCVSPVDLALMRRIDELHLDYPFAGARMLRDLLAGEGIRVGRLHVHTNEADRHRGDLPQTQHLQACAGPQDLSIPAAQAGSDAA